MKGFIKDKKFHPITESKGIRKSRDISEKTQGIRLARTKEGTKLEGVWFRGNVFKGSDFTADEFAKTKKYAEDVKKPTALRTKVIKGKEYSQYYFKPIQVGEFTD